jgi:hypothetical protein
MPPSNQEQKPKQPPPPKVIAASAIIPRSIDELMQLATIVFKAGPPAGHGRAESVAMAIAFGMEIGLLPVQSVASVSVIGGKPSLYGDAALGLLLASPFCEKLDHGLTGVGDSRCGWIATKRKGQEVERKSDFNVDDAKQAGLWLLDQPLPADPEKAAKKRKASWYAYPDRMLVWKAVSHHMKDWWADVLRGLTIYEDVVAEIEVRSEARDQRAVVVDAKVSESGETLRGMPYESESKAVDQAALADKPVVADGTTATAPIRDDQLAKLAELKPVFLAVRNVGVSDKVAVNDAWRALLAHWKVETARTLTAAQADELIAAIVESRDKCDPSVRGLFRLG